MTSTALLITHDEQLVDDLLRLAAAAGVGLDVARDTTAALRGWGGASVVLLGAESAEQVAEQHPPRRDQVHVVGHAPVPDQVFRSALAAGADAVLELPTADAWLVELLSDAADAADGRNGRRARTLGVIGGSGGVGATTFACALASVASTTAAAVLLDLDPLGPGVDRVVGLEAAGGVRWDELLSSRGRLSSRSLRAALPARDGLAVLTWGAGASADLDAATLREVLSAAQRGHDTVLVDLPRTLDAATAEVVTRCDHVVLVAEATVAGVAAAGKVAARLAPLTPGVTVAVRGRTRGVAAEQVAAVLGLPLGVEVPHQRRLAEHVDLGLGPVHSPRSRLAKAARAILSQSREAQVPEEMGARAGAGRTAIGGRAFRSVAA